MCKGQRDTATRVLTTRDNVRAQGTMVVGAGGRYRENEGLLNTYYMPDVTLTLGINLGHKCCPSFTLRHWSVSDLVPFFRSWRGDGNVSPFRKMGSAHSNLLPGRDPCVSVGEWCTGASAFGKSPPPG